MNVYCFYNTILPLVYRETVKKCLRNYVIHIANIGEIAVDFI